jgi:AcrR family transcriptional regulator
VNAQTEIGVRETILERATGLFVTHGYEGISIREIAEACRLSKAGLYYHFKDKEALFLAILDENLNELHKIFGQIALQPGGAREKIAAFVRAIFTDLPADHRAVIRLATQDMGKITPAARADFDRRYQEQFLSPLSQIIEEGTASGQVRPIEPFAAVWALLGLMYPFLTHSSVQTESGSDRTIELIVDIYLNGIANQTT